MQQILKSKFGYGQCGFTLHISYLLTYLLISLSMHPVHYRAAMKDSKCFRVFFRVAILLMFYSDLPDRGD